MFEIESIYGLQIIESLLQSELKISDVDKSKIEPIKMETLIKFFIYSWCYFMPVNGLRYEHVAGFGVLNYQNTCKFQLYVLTSKTV